MKKNIKKYIPWVVLLLIIISLSTAYLLSRRVTQEQLLAYESRITEAEKYLEARQYSMSVSKFQEASDIIPRRVDAYEGIVSILLLKNRVEDSEQVVRKSATALGSYDRSLLYKMIGDKYYEQGEYQKASEMYENGLTLGVRNTALELKYGKVMLKKGEISVAKKYLQRSGFAHEEQVEANLILSYIYSTEDISKSKKFIKTIEPTSSFEIYYEEIEEILNDLDEDKKFNASKLSRVYINQGYPFLAITILEPLKEEMIEYLEGMYFLGRAYTEFGDYSEAIEILNSASTLGGMETEIFWLRARSYYMQKDLENTVRDYDNAIGYMGENVQEELVEEYLNVLLEINQKLKAEEVVRNLAFNFSENAFVNMMAVKVNYKLEQNAKVDYYLRELEALELDKGIRKEYLEYKLLYLFDQNSFDMREVEKYMEELFEIDRFNPYYYYFLANVQKEKGEVELAGQSLERSIEYDVNYEITKRSKEILSSLR
ncbi:MAG: hypothetical protein PHP96_01785 [Candidatus Dojkabacteria bacterium]|nr:hypothetical protein [Candidatus Dojkabacteria bacterium]MDD4561256.1 hypothetical protein [Candidatus Dojkabacteria bacterium]